MVRWRRGRPILIPLAFFAANRLRGVQGAIETQRLSSHRSRLRCRPASRLCRGNDQSQPLDGHDDDGVADSRAVAAPRLPALAREADLPVWAAVGQHNALPPDHRHRADRDRQMLGVGRAPPAAQVAPQRQSSPCKAGYGFVGRRRSAAGAGRDDQAVWRAEHPGRDPRGPTQPTFSGGDILRNGSVSSAECGGRLLDFR
jgi:hypothetical protein